MFNKKENALVQMADASQAQLGTDSGDVCFAYGFSLRMGGAELGGVTLQQHFFIVFPFLLAPALLEALKFII